MIRVRCIEIGVSWVYCTFQINFKKREISRTTRIISKHLKLDFKNNLKLNKIYSWNKQLFVSLALKVKRTMWNGCPMQA